MTINVCKYDLGSIGGNNNQEKNLLIVGDWVIDEYWFLVRHHSDTSTHTGLAHYRVINEPPEDVIRGLCGAGHVARVLLKLMEKDNPKNVKIKLYGIGNWNKNDTELIMHLVHDCKSTKVSKEMKKIEICRNPLPNLKLSPINQNSHTIRVIRLYHYAKEGLEQINRVDFDWEHNAENGSNLPNDLPEQVDMIIVQDLQKGCVTQNLIKALKIKYKDALWCVRSKNEKIDWLEDIKDKKVVLQFICPDISQLLNPWGSWLFEDHPSRQAIEIIDSYNEKGIKNIVLSSYNREVVALFNDKLYVGKSLVKPTLLNQLGWADAVYASLIFKIVENENLDEEALSFALGRADEHLAIKVPKKSELKPEQRNPKVDKEGDWEEVKEAWNVATGKTTNQEKMGIIIRNGNSNLDVWRSSTELFGYIACIQEKVKILRQIGHKLRSFKKDPTPARPLSILIQADPGSGKTTLAKALARCFGFTLVHRDITQMIHRDELVDLFDEIATKQANGANKILVFVDEINANLEGEPVYGAFLAPLEESVYARKGGIYRLQPCAWIFAGTNLEEDSPSKIKGYKLSDFKSRMTMFEKIDYSSIIGKTKEEDKERIEKETRLEQVYLGAWMIKQFFPDVKEISEEVLYEFYLLDPEETPARKIRQWASALKNVQYGKVTRENCKEWEGAKWEKNLKSMVKINFK
jgi:hypothetical protein